MIFKFPVSGDYVLGPDQVPAAWPKEPLVYIEWYSRLKNTAEADHGMYMISKSNDIQGLPSGSIVALSAIRQSCMLIPKLKMLTMKKLGLVAMSWTMLGYFY